MRALKCLILVLLFTAFTGCVSSKEYKARLADIDGLRNTVSGLEAQVGGLKEETTAVSMKLKSAEEENAGLRSRVAALEDENASFAMESASLRTQVTDIARQRDSAVADKEKAIVGMRSTYDNLVSELNQEIREGQIAITQLQDRLSLTMVEKILFDSGSAAIKTNGRKVLDRVGEILKKVEDKQITIEGHTDNVPISMKLRERFPTNWELSTTRATNVARYLQENAGIAPRLLIAAGFAEHRPVASNDTEEGRARNRRIEIVLVPMPDKTSQAE